MGGSTSKLPTALTFTGDKTKREPDNDYFEPTYKIAWLIGSEKYEKVVVQGKIIYKDVTQSKQDIENMTTLLFQLKFDEIITTIDPTCKKDYEEGIKKLYTVCQKANANTQVLLCVYYSGHGVMKNTNYCVVNTSDMWERYFNMEEQVCRLTELKNVMGLLIFDCCRDNPGEGEDVKAKKPFVPKKVEPKPKTEEEKKEVAKPKATPSTTA